MVTHIETLKKISWRDPSGFVAKNDGRIFRAVTTARIHDVQLLLAAAWYQQGVADGWFPESEWVGGRVPFVVDTSELRWLEHRALAFPCYAHEITALQLYDAAKLTLSIAMAALENGWIIKDASAWNILFEHGKPRFCDILSFERADDSGIWIAYAQFCRHFLIPLLLYRDAGVQPASLFMLHRDGVQPDQAKRILGGWRAYVQPTLEAVTLPALFGRLKRSRANSGHGSNVKSAELARFLLGRTLKRLDKHIDTLKPAASVKPTKWENYQTDRDHYSAPDVLVKTDFVRSAMQEPHISSVLDLGCNAGEFSKVVAHAGKTVLAADYDHGALSRLYNEIRGAKLAISPILLDIGRPTPAVGWMNREVESFMVRASGKFDCIMALGLVHHLLVSERASLSMILEFFLTLDARFLVLEWIEPKDRRFTEIAGINEQLYSNISIKNFEAIFSKNYYIARKEELVGGNRVLYFLKKRS